MELCLGHIFCVQNFCTGGNSNRELACLHTREFNNSHVKRKTVERALHSRLMLKHFLWTLHAINMYNVHVHSVKSERTGTRWYHTLSYSHPLQMRLLFLAVYVWVGSCFAFKFILVSRTIQANIHSAQEYIAHTECTRSKVHEYRVVLFSRTYVAYVFLVFGL